MRLMRCRFEAWALEPFSVKHILNYANALLEHLWISLAVPDAQYAAFQGEFARLLRFCMDRVEAVADQAALGRMNVADATQLIGRVGMWMDKVPERIGGRLNGGGDSAGLLQFHAQWVKDDEARRAFASAHKAVRGAYDMGDRGWARRRRAARRREEERRKVEAGERTWGEQTVDDSE